VEADAEMRRSPLPRVELEIAAVRATRRPAPQALDTLIAKVEDAIGRLGSAGAAGGRPGAVQESLLGAPAAPQAGGRGTLTPAEAPAGARGGGAPAPGSAVLAPPPRGAAPGPGGGRAANTPGGSRRAAPGSGGASAPADAPEASDRPEPAGSEVSGAPASESGDALAERWGLVVAHVMRRRALLGTVLQHATPLGLAAGVLTVSLGGGPFHRELLADQANRELINQALQQHVPGARRIHVDTDAPAQSDARSHPAVQAAVEAFQGDIVAVRPRVPGEGDTP
jgi:hypothetical protein